MKAYWVIAPRILDLGTRWRWVFSFTPRPLNPRGRAPSIHCIGGWVGLTTSLDAVVRRKIPSPRRESKPRTPILQSVAQRYTDWAITALCSYTKLPSRPVRFKKSQIIHLKYEYSNLKHISSFLGIAQWYSAGLQIGWSGFNSWQGLGIFLFTTASRTALLPAQPPILLGVLFLGVKRPGREADHSPPSSAEVKNMRIYTSAPQRALMTWCWV
jgi:hypothetical protein